MRTTGFLPITAQRRSVIFTAAFPLAGSSVRASALANTPAVPIDIAATHSLRVQFAIKLSLEDIPALSRPAQPACGI